MFTAKVHALIARRFRYRLCTHTSVFARPALQTPAGLWSELAGSCTAEAAWGILSEQLASWTSYWKQWDTRSEQVDSSLAEKGDSSFFPRSLTPYLKQFFPTKFAGVTFLGGPLGVTSATWSHVGHVEFALQVFPELKNDLILRAASGEPVERVPVRGAGNSRNLVHWVVKSVEISWNLRPEIRNLLGNQSRNPKSNPTHAP